ncbi:MAG: T9SS type A sorting domain-containing protein [bacterium]|nr:T9SS type A sorting domain-containing protein [bacterium]
MDNFEQKFNHAHAPESSVKSHRDALRSKLNTPAPRSRARKSLLAVTALFIVSISGLTIANPNWVSDVVKIVTHESHFTSADGKQEYYVKTMEIEGPADSVAQALAQMKADGQVGDWTFDPADPANAELLKHDGAKKMVFVEANVEDHGDGSGPMEKQMIIESRDGGKTFTINGEKTVTAEELAQIQAQHGIVQKMINTEGGVATIESAPELAATFELKQNYPNPFNPTTQIPFELKEAGNVTMKVYDLTGREVATLLNGYQSAGSHTVAFDGTSLASGTYLYKLDVNGNQFSRTMILMK